MNIPPYRDEELGSALLELDVPEHRADFYSELREAVAEERSAARRRARLRWGARLAVVAAAAAVVAVVIGLPRAGRGPDVASAATVRSAVRQAFADLRTLRGILVDGSLRLRFALDAAGDVRIEGPAAGEVMVYDAATGVVRSAQRSSSLGSDTLFYAERDGVAPGPPDLGPPTWSLPGRFAAYVRAALAAGDPRVVETTYRGRPAWSLSAAADRNRIVPERSGDRLDITVDRATGMPVRVVERQGARVLRELRIEELVANAGLPRGTFDLAFPVGAEAMRSDDGFRRVPLADAPGALVPAWVPEGYRLAEVAVAAEAAPTGKEAANPVSRNVVSLSYRRGLDQFLVTARDRGNGVWDDPLASGEGFVDPERRVELANGTTARVVVAPRREPHLWLETGDRVITVGGDLSEAELVRVAGSLG